MKSMSNRVLDEYLKNLKALKKSPKDAAARIRVNLLEYIIEGDDTMDLIRECER